MVASRNGGETSAVRPSAHHAPGPWRLLPASFSPRIYVLREDATADEAAIAEVIDRANARLIAAAPDLLEALKAVDRQVFCDCPEHSHCITHEPGCFIPILRAAIAKATGDAS